MQPAFRTALLFGVGGDLPLTYAADLFLAQGNIRTAMAAFSDGADALFQRIDQSFPDERIRGLARIALSEVDDLDACLRRLALRLLDAHEGVRGLRGQDGGEAHGRTLACGGPSRA